MSKLSTKTCLVTGAAQGIGASIVKTFLSEGALVIAADLQYEGTGTTFDADGRLNRRLDVTDPKQVQALVADFPQINVLVNCAGYVAAGDAMTCTAEDFQRSVDLNVTATFSVTTAVLPRMVEAEDGVIINIASVVSSYMAAPKASVAMRSAQERWTRPHCTNAWPRPAMQRLHWLHSKRGR